MKARNDFPEQEMRTELQWAQAGFVVRPEQAEQGQTLWTNHFHSQSALYFTSEQVTVAVTNEQKEQVSALLEPRKKRANALRQQHRQEEKSRRQRKEKLAEGWKLCRAAQPIQADPPAHMIVLDAETTGLDIYGDNFPDEILQLSILDGSGQTLFNSYIKPYAHDIWPGAQTVNGISPEMVSDAPYLHEVAPQIKGILNGAVLWVGYNIIGFDRPLLEQALGHFTHNPQVYDVMLEFAPIYGEWSEKYSDYRYQSLSVCADYFEIQFHAHDSLEDARATLSCFQAIQHLRQLQRLGRPPKGPEKIER